MIVKRKLFAKSKDNSDAKEATGVILMGGVF